MNAIERDAFQRQVAGDLNCDAIGLLAAIALLFLVDWETGVCTLPVATIGKYMRRADDAARAGLKELERRGHIEIKRNFNGPSSYTPKLRNPPKKPEPTARKTPDSSPRKTRHLTEDDSMNPIEQNRTPQAAASSRRRFDALPPEIQILVRGFQRMTKAPYCASYDRLIPAVIRTVKRVGLAPVEQLYTMLSNHSDAMHAIKLYQALDALQGESDVSAPPKAEDSAPGCLITEAKALVEAAHKNPSAMNDIMTRCKAAGHRLPWGWWAENRHGIAQALARTMKDLRRQEASAGGEAEATSSGTESEYR